MTDYARIFNFASKDALTTGDPAKLIKGSEVDQELDAIATAIATKLNLPSSPVSGDVLTWNGSAWVAGTAGLMPIGTILSFGGLTLPSEFLWADGSLISTTTYASLFASYSYTYGGSGSNFALPDLRGRAPFGLDNMNNSVGTGGGDAGRLTSGSASGIDGDTLGSTGGDEEHALTTDQMPSHNHGVAVSITVDTSVHGTSGTVGSGANLGGTAINAAAATTNVSFAGGSTAHTNMPPTVVTNFIIYSGV